MMDPLLRVYLIVFAALIVARSQLVMNLLVGPGLTTVLFLCCSPALIGAQQDCRIPNTEKRR